MCISVVAGKRRVVLASGGPAAWWRGGLGWTHQLYVNERALLAAFVALLLAEDPDFVIGYNSNLYDIPHVTVRCRALGVSTDWGRIHGHQTRYIMSEQTTNQRGTMNIGIVDIPGRICLDAMVLLGLGFDKLRSYGLARVAEHFELPVSKDDVE